MSDETRYDQNSNPFQTEAQTSAGSEPVGFCQDCGKPLTSDTVRPVGSGVFCEPCLQNRLAGGAPAGYTGAVGYGAAPAGYPGNPAPVAGEPSPVLAGLLGFIPGVGAMYNGQFAKGIAHIAIFAVLVSLSDHVNGVFGIFVAGWVFYQVFEAIHTARARRDGTPLPNAFGLNDIGDRLGFGKNWPGSHSRPVSTFPPFSVPTQAPPAGVPTATDWTPVPPVAPVPPTNWAGYVPPQHFGQAYASPIADAQAAVDQAQAAVNDANALYAGYENVYHAPPVGTLVPPPVTPASRFPAGAIWLIGLGALFLISNVIPDFHFKERWFVPLLFLGLAIYSFFRRSTNPRYSGLAALRLPVAFVALSVIFTLQALDIATIGQTWPLILILLGVYALIDRSAALRGVQVGAQPQWAATPVTPASAPFVSNTVEAGTESHNAPGAGQDGHQ